MFCSDVKVAKKLTFEEQELLRVAWGYDALNPILAVFGMDGVSCRVAGIPLESAVQIVVNLVKLNDNSYSGLKEIFKCLAQNNS